MWRQQKLYAENLVGMGPLSVVAPKQGMFFVLFDAARWLEIFTRFNFSTPGLDSLGLEQLRSKKQKDENEYLHCT